LTVDSYLVKLMTSQVFSSCSLV